MSSSTRRAAGPLIMVSSLLLGLPLMSALAAEPHPSLSKLVSANGYGVVVFNGIDPDKGVLDHFSDHLYQRWDASSEDVWDLLYDTYFGVRTSSSLDLGPWLTGYPSVSYENGTGVIDIVRSWYPLEIHEIVFAPSEMPWPGIVQILTVTNVSAWTAEQNTVFSLQNYHLGSDVDADGLHTGDESLWTEGGSLFEWGDTTGLAMTYRPVPAASTLGCESVYDTVLAGGDLDGACGDPASPMAGDDRVGGFQWDLGEIAVGETRVVAVLHAFESGWDLSGASAALDGLLTSEDPLDILAEERTFWENWHAAGHPPPKELNEEESAIYRQSLAFLKMAQVQEESSAQGQIPASFPIAGEAEGFDHFWSITWVRDSTYAILALLESGHYDEAADALAFLLQDRAGGYSSELGLSDYSVSVCRCYGNGDEWSDDDGSGPNIELDGWGMVAYALARYVELSGDTSFADEHLATALDQNALLLTSLIETSGEAEGLILADSSIWERHWNGNQKHFTFTDAWAVAGMRALSALAEPSSADTLQSAAETVTLAIQAQLVDPEAGIVGNLEEYLAGEQWKDLAAVEVFNLGVLDPQNPVATRSFATWDSSLKFADGPRYFRNDDGSAYDNAEWPFMDLRLAEARRRACDEKGAREIEDWVTAQAALNHQTVPELMTAANADYAGPAPMLGFGAGAYVLAMLHRDTARADCATGPTEVDTGDTESDSDSDSDSDTDSDTDGDSDSGHEDTGGLKDIGCSCAQGNRGKPSLFPLLLTLLSLVRRRRSART